ncbi:hypothetical protein SLS62_011237 [Diatrype stigma]|uniref:Ribosomal RNA methyltransferase FtsJ domain-containing protein n=1 Tax=Diatrype stigma TaxID=117547 RepID=A0AAN9YFT6_9PEZI
MALPVSEESVQHEAAHDAAISGSDEGDTPSSPSPTEPRARTPNAIVKEYLLERVPEFRRLDSLREEGWQRPEGDAHFARQRHTADTSNQNGKTAWGFYKRMLSIAQELHDSTGALQIRHTASDPAILDMCAAPGGFLEVAMNQNPGACAVAFSLPESVGGHKLLMPRRSDVMCNFLDVTMLAADMGVGTGMAKAPEPDDTPKTAPTEQGKGQKHKLFGEVIPDNHPDADYFIRERQLQVSQKFDLVFCDGQVLRTHEEHRATYREKREATRLTLTQLALGLEHLRPGGTMVVLLHKVEAWDTVMLLRTFDRFTTGSTRTGRGVRTFKPRAGHKTRSSFYLVAMGVRSDSPEAHRAIARWKNLWRVATFGTDEEWTTAKYGDSSNEENVENLLEEFGDKLVALGRSVWKIQAQALKKAPFMQDAWATARPREFSG